MRELTTLCLSFSVLAFPFTVFGADLADGSKCELSKPVRVSAKAKGKGKKTQLKKGAVLEVVSFAKAWSEVGHEDGTGFIRTKQLNKFCTPQAEQAEAAVVDAPDGGDETTAAAESAEAAEAAGDAVPEAMPAAGDNSTTGAADESAPIEDAPADTVSTSAEETPPTEEAPAADAAAPSPEPEEFDSDSDSDDRSGLILNLGVGLHSTSQAVGSSSVGTDESLAYDLHTVWRYSNTQSIGVGYFLNTYSLPDPASMKFHGIMTHWRYYLPFGAFEPFLELGAGWVWWSMDVSSGGGGFSAKGINLDGALGAFYHVLDFLAVGASARLNLPAFTSLCTDTGAGEVCGTPSSNMKDISYGLVVAFNPFAL